MDPASVITLCKENIQPLRHGRNAAQLGTALRAQEDAEAHQLLLNEKQMYEDAIKNYEGDDPLEVWYDYIIWVEQSYPKSGHESHIGKLLQQCLAAFEKETKYHQDRRYIRLWINYISMQKNPLELYQLIYNNGIGTMVADMYRAWAFELEQVNDSNRADEVYSIGIRAGAEPRDELAHAHQNFQFSVARKTLGRMEERNELSLMEQRQAFSSLRAIKAGKRVTNIRTGNRVRDYQPGVIAQSSHGHISRVNSKITVYQDEPVPLENRGSSILDHVPIEETVHKENTIKPGPWSNSSRKHPLIPPTVKTSFKIHEDRIDDNYDMDKLRLFPNHVQYFDGSNYPEHKTVPVYVAEQSTNVTTKPHYPKDLVYFNNIDRSMEEIRADNYLKLRLTKKNNNDENLQLNLINGHDIQKQINRFDDDEDDDNDGMKKQEMEQQRRNYEIERLKFEADKQKREKERLEIEQREIERRQVEQMEIERQRREEIERQRRDEIERQRREEIERQRREEIERQRREEIERQRREEIERQRREEIERQRCEEMERQRIEAERIEAERIESQRMEAELNRQRKLQTTNYMHHGSTNSSIDPSMEHLLGQSMTVNTKEAMSVVQDLWHSPNDDGSPIVNNQMQHRINDSRAKFNFDIHMDSSMTQQHAMSTSKHHSSYNIQPYHDQENQHYSGYSNHQQSFRNHGLPDPYHQYQVPHHQMQPPQMHMMQSPHIQHPVSHHSQHYSPQISQSPQIPQSPQIQHHQSHMHNIPQSSHQSLQTSQHHQSHHHHQSPVIQHHMYNNMHQNNVRYSNIQPPQQSQQQYPMMQPPPPQPHHIEPQKQLQFTSPYVDQQADNKAYRMPELPYIKSPGMNRRDLKYLESTDNKENAAAAVAGYNSGIEDNKQDNSLFIDESLGIAPLGGANETCYTDGFAGPLTSSTPMTNQFRPPTHRTKELPQYQPPQQVHLPPAQLPEIQTTSEPDEKLSVILESTREYISSSSGSSVRTGGFGFATREDLGAIQEQSTQDIESTEALLVNHNSRDQSLRVKIQAVQAQSPRTVQRNVDQITSEINHCDLRIPLKLDAEPPSEEKSSGSMECQYNEPMEEVEEEEFVLPTGDFNPFDKTLISGLLRKIKFPQKHHSDGYHRTNTNLNKFLPSSVVNFGPDTYEMEKCLGKGTYGTVMKALHSQTGQVVALKTQRPAWVWEYYIAREIKARITNPHMLRGFMNTSNAYVANNASVLVSEFSKYGTLLAVTNQVKLATGKPLAEALAIFFTIEMLQIVDYLHKCQIIHGDIKPDNFLLMHLPTEDVRPTIQLIDFGCSIDMSLFPEGTKFTQIIKTEDFTCIEMQTGRPWTYQTDLYCLAASAHCLLFGNYMRVTHTGDKWFITSKMPRYVKKAAWENFFTELLNIESCDKMPDLNTLRSTMEEALADIPSLDSKFRSFANVLNKR